MCEPRRTTEGNGAGVSIEVRDYDPSWPRVAEAACTELRSALPNVFAVIEHIGSTAVPGLAAKPIIDLMAAAELDAVLAQEGALEILDYKRHETGMPNRLFYRRDRNGRRTHNLHVVPIRAWETRNELLLRDYLRGHPEETARYADLKRKLAGVRTNSRDYTREKTQFIQETTDRARAERGLPPGRPVWEERSF